SSVCRLWGPMRTGSGTPALCLTLRSAQHLLEQEGKLHSGFSQVEAAEREFECPVKATEKRRRRADVSRRPSGQHHGSQGTSLLPGRNRSESSSWNFGDGVILS
ncbi:hypothetical protein P7K49_008961, partial [Saguinus oedipus]